jgi:hypothetical protein
MMVSIRRFPKVLPLTFLEGSLGPGTHHRVLLFPAYSISAMSMGMSLTGSARVSTSSCTYASWLNQVEIWFNIMTQKAIRRGAFSSVKELIAKIEQFVKAYNAKSHPFTWTARADSILQKIERLSKAISETEHYDDTFRTLYSV